MQTADNALKKARKNLLFSYCSHPYSVIQLTIAKIQAQNVRKYYGGIKSCVGDSKDSYEINKMLYKNTKEDIYEC